MGKESKGFLGYSILDGKQVNAQDSLSIGRFFKEGGGTYEFGIEWEVLGGKNVPKLTVFDDGWRGLYEENQPLLKRLAENNNKNLQIADMIKILKELKYKKF